MKKVLLLLGFTMMVSSCATITNRKQQKLRIYSSKAEAKALVNDSIYSLPATVTVTRSKEDLKVKLITDSITKDYIVKSSPNAAFIYGNLFFMQAFPIGYAVDFNTQKRFYYGHKIDLNDTDSITTIVPRLAKGYINYFTKSYPAHKGQINATLSLPWGNHYYVQPRNESTSRLLGFIGAAAGAEYYYKEHKYLALKGTYTLDFFFPVLVPLSEDGAHETLSAATFTLTDNHKLRRFTIGYGINYSIYRWQLVNNEYNPINRLNPENLNDTDLRPSLKKDSHALGFTVNGYHQLTKVLFIGLIYSPTLYTVFPANEFRYQHLVSLDFAWKIKLWKGAQK